MRFEEHVESLISEKYEKQDLIDQISYCYKLNDSNSERKIIVAKDQKQVIIYTENVNIKGNPNNVKNCIKYISHINDYLQIGCFEMITGTFSFRFRTGQAFFADADPTKITRFYLDYHDNIFPKIIDGLIQVIEQNKNPTESAQFIIRQLD